MPIISVSSKTVTQASAPAMVTSVDPSGTLAKISASGAITTSIVPVGLAITDSGLECIISDVNTNTVLYKTGGLSGSWSSGFAIGGGNSRGASCKKDGGKYYVVNSGGAVYSATSLSSPNWALARAALGGALWGGGGGSADGSVVAGILYGNTSINYTLNSGATWASIATGHGNLRRAMCSNNNSTIYLFSEAATPYLSRFNIVGGAISGGLVSYSGWATSGLFSGCCSYDGDIVYGIAQVGGTTVNVYKHVISTSTKTLVDTYATGGSGNGNCDITCSDDGRIVFTTADFGPLRYSTDYGVTWADFSGGAAKTRRSWGIDCSRDGSKFVICSYQDGIYSNY